MTVISRNREEKMYEVMRNIAVKKKEEKKERRMQKKGRCQKYDDER